MVSAQDQYQPHKMCVSSELLASDFEQETQHDTIRAALLREQKPRRARSAGVDSVSFRHRQEPGNLIISHCVLSRSGTAVKGCLRQFSATRTLGVTAA